MVHSGRLETISDWFKANKLTLNISKSVCMLFSRNVKNIWEYSFPGLSIDGTDLQKVSSTKFLGLNIDDKLDWTDHYNKLLCKLKRNLQMLRTGKNLLSQHAKKLLYYGHIYSHMSYCISTWGPMISDQKIAKLQNIQDKCIDLLDLTRKPLKDKYQNNKILNVNKLIDLECCKLGY